MFKDFDYILNIKRISLFFLAIYVSYIVANVFITLESAIFIKLSIGVIAALLFFKLAFSISVENLIVLIILLLAFPVVINLGGKDLGTTNTIIIYTIFIVYAARKVLRKETIFPDRPLFIAVLCIFLAYVISFINTPVHELNSALRRTSILVSCIIIFYMIINNVKSKRAIIKMVDAITIICLIEALIVIFQLIFPEYSNFLEFFGSREVGLRRMGLTVEGRRIATTFGFDYEIASEFFAINIAIQFFLIKKLRKSFKRKFYVICLLLNIIALVPTGTRGGIVSLSAGLLITMFLTRKYHNFTKNLILFCLIGVLLFSTIIFFAQYVPQVASLKSRFEKLKIYETETGGSFIETINRSAWSVTVSNIMKHPWIGHGPYDVGKVVLEKEKLHNPHSTYLYYLFNIGIIGTLPVLYFFGGIFRHGFTVIRKRYKNEAVYILIALMAAFIVFSIDAIKISYQRHSNMQQFIWIIFALIISTARIAKDGNGGENTISYDKKEF